jgi:hypothetical protein
MDVEEYVLFARSEENQMMSNFSLLTTRFAF